MFFVQVRALAHAHSHKRARARTLMMAGSSCCFHGRELPIVSLEAYHLYVLLLLTKEVDIWLLIANWLYGKGKSEVFGFHHLH